MLTKHDLEALARGETITTEVRLVQADSRADQNRGTCPTDGRGVFVDG